MMRLYQLLLLLILGLLLTSCRPEHLSEKQIVRKYFRQAAVSYDDQGRIIRLGCPKARRDIEMFFSDMLPDPAPCPLNGSLPPEIGQLDELQSLRLSNASITTLPPETGNLTKLEILELPRNNLTT